MFILYSYTINDPLREQKLWSIISLAVKSKTVPHWYRPHYIGIYIYTLYTLNNL